MSRTQTCAEAWLATIVTIPQGGNVGLQQCTARQNKCYAPTHQHHQCWTPQQGSFVGNGPRCRESTGLQYEDKVTMPLNTHKQTLSPRCKQFTQTLTALGSARHLHSAMHSGIIFMYQGPKQHMAMHSAITTISELGSTLHNHSVSHKYISHLSMA